MVVVTYYISYLRMGHLVFISFDGSFSLDYLAKFFFQDAMLTIGAFAIAASIAPAPVLLSPCLLWLHEMLGGQSLNCYRQQLRKVAALFLLIGLTLSFVVMFVYD